MALDRAPNVLRLGQPAVGADQRLTREAHTSLEELWRQVVAGFVVVPCEASTALNVITLTPRLHQEGGANYGTGMLWSFVADATSTGAVTAGVGGLGALKVYKRAGAAQAGSGDVVAGSSYILMYDSALDSGAGGFVLFGGAFEPYLSTPPVRSVVLQVFTGSTTYVPTANMVYSLLGTLGSGAGGGGAAANAAGQQSGGGGGGAGSFSMKLATAAQIGASQSVTIGAGVNGGAAGNNNGTDGNDTSIGALCIGKGGTKGLGAAAGAAGIGGLGGVAGTGDITGTGAPGGHAPAYGSIITIVGHGGIGGSSWLGGGGKGGVGGIGLGATNYGGGGGGGHSFNASGAMAGGASSQGIAFALDFCSV